MKSVFLVLSFLLVAGCHKIPPAYEVHHAAPDTPTQISCDTLNDINWSNQSETISQLEECYTLARRDMATPGGIRDNTYVDAMLYLSYIYLSDTPNQNIPRANTILTHAIHEMSKDCQDAHGTYDNFCYMLEFKEYEEIPTYFATLHDALHLYQMSMPCVYVEMLVDNPDALTLISPYFGGSRDSFIPGLCNSFSSNHIINLLEFHNLENFDNLKKTYVDGPLDGSMRFGIHRRDYKTMVEMLLYPDKMFAENDADAPYVIVYSIGADPQPIKTALKPFESEIRRYPDLSGAYDKMLENVKRHYVDFLHLSPDVATKYAPITVLSTLYNDILS